MTLARERLAAFGNAMLGLPRQLPQLALRSIKPNRALIEWCKETIASGHLPVVLCRIERLGDIVATTAVAGHLRQTHGPRARIAWVCAAEYVSLLAGNPDIDAVFVEPCLTTWMMVRRHLAPQTLIVELFLDSDRCCWTGLRVKQHKTGWSIHNYYCEGNSLLAAYSAAAGCPVPDLPPQLPRFVRQRAARLPAPAAAKPRVAVHFSSRDPARSWPIENARTFCHAALAAGCELIELGNERLVSAQPSPVACLPPGSEIASHVEALATVDCFVGVDSGFAHCANALEVPALVLLGAFRNFSGYFPYSGPHARGPLWRCLRSEGSLAQLTPGNVSAALLQLLAAGRLWEQGRGADYRAAAATDAPEHQPPFRQVVEKS